MSYEIPGVRWLPPGPGGTPTMPRSSPVSYHNFETYDAQLQGRCRDRRKLANNTYLERCGENIGVRLHDTVVVLYRPNGNVSLYTGGWLTVTTKERINRFSAARVGSVKGRWMIYNGAGWDNPLPFAEGVTLHPDGSITGVPADIDVKAQDRQNAKTRRDIKRFVDGITPERIITAWENSSGDCWFCMADGPGDSCLADHVRQDYFHAHLALRAVKAAGYRDPTFIMQMIYADAQAGRTDNILTRALTKLLRKNLIEGVATK